MNERGRTDRRLQAARASDWGLVILACAATLFFLQGFRVFVPYLVFEIDQSEREQLASIGVAVFALAVLGALLYRLAGGRATLWLAVAGMIVARIGLQFLEDPQLRWVLGAATVIGWCWIVIGLLPQSGDRLSVGIGFAFAIDLVIRGLRGTLDLPWMPGTVEHLVAIVIAALLVLATYVVTSSKDLDTFESTFAPSLRYVGIGSGIALWLVAAGNPGFAEVRGNLELPAAFALLILGVLVALALHIGAGARWSPVIDERAKTIGPGLFGVLAILAWNAGPHRWLDMLLLPVFAAAVTSLTMRAAVAAPPREIHGRWRCGVTLTLGLLIQTAFVFLYFARSGPMQLMLLPILVLAVAPLTRQRSGTAGPSIGIALQRGVLAMALLSVVTFAWLLVDEHHPGSASPGTADLTVMTFNIQEGFSNENDWSLETTARTIEAHDPDIVFLQEITRGWLVMSSVDQVRWLANRLDMEYAYVGNSHDGLWGNAILSRLPIVSERSVVYTITDNLRRGAVGIEVQTEAGTLLAIDTHLDNLRRGTPVRLEQIEELIDFWGTTTPAIIAGDFNADPGSPEWQAMTDAGFVDAAGSDTATTSEDNRRIDYIWLTPDLTVGTYTVPEVWVSDHRPVVVELTMPV